jgi:hypothetical protein
MDHLGKILVKIGAIFILRKGKGVGGWVGGIAKYLLFLTGEGGGFESSLRKLKRLPLK